MECRKWLMLPLVIFLKSLSFCEKDSHGAAGGDW